MKTSNHNYTTEKLYNYHKNFKKYLLKPDINTYD
jgi:hypothetical protein